MTVALSVVVVTFDMRRALPRTLRSLTTPYQRHIDPGDYEIIVVDNGSPQPVATTLPDDLRSTARVHRLEAVSTSPARAANLGIGLARGEVVGLVVDGARMASPGLLAGARRGALMGPRAVVTAPAWHLGPDLQVHAEATGYDEAVEDELLAGARWEDDGYRLFSIATPAASSGRGLFGPMGESSSLFLHRTAWSELGGLDEHFALPGGGLVNHDLYRRACALPDAQLVVLVGEGTFHQIHGGATTSGRVTREAMRREYEAIRGEGHAPPPNRPMYLGSVPPEYLPYLEASIALAQAAATSRGAAR
jgi:hypothetical protein